VGAAAAAARSTPGARRYGAQPAGRHRGRPADPGRVLPDPELRRRYGQARPPGPRDRAVAAVRPAARGHLLAAAPCAARPAPDHAELRPGAAAGPGSVT